MDNLETLALVDVPGSSRDLRAMQALARDVVQADAPASRLAPLERMLQRDLDAAIAGRAAPWTATRTRLEARKLARLAPDVAATEPQDAAYPPDPSGHYEATPAPTAEERKRQVIARVAIVLVAAALWTIWILSLGASGPVAWDGGSGPGQAQNLFTLYAPAVLALLATLIAVDSLGNSSQGNARA